MNKKKWITIGIIVAVVLIIGGIFIGQYNGFVNAEEDINQAKSNIQTLLQKRVDKISQLVDTVKGYTGYESETYLDVTEARNAVSNATDIASTQNAIEKIEEVSTMLEVTVEAYPDLKADKQYLALMDEISSIENEIQYARTQYNEKATDFNKKIRRFPGNLFASMYGFNEPVDLFVGTESAQSAPENRFN